MSIIENEDTIPAVGTSDKDAIANLRSAFERQRAAFAIDRNPSIDERRARIQALMGMMAANRERVSAALSADFGSHPAAASDLIEVLGVLGRAGYVLEHLEEWMAPSERDIDAALLGSATAAVRYQPKGVIGNIIPWNFPFDIGVGPVIEMLAAGNRVILKPSDYTPACGALLAEMVAEAFDPAIVHVAVGSVDLARAFASIPWDHLLYTGSPGVGREVMTAAAANLTPVTLELGGKCPAILTKGSVTSSAVGSILGTKTIKNGQMCVTVDYCMVPRDELEAFIDLAQAHMAAANPSYSRSGDCTGIISVRHLDRLGAMLDEAEHRQTRIVLMEEDGVVDRETRRMPMSLVINPAADLSMMKEEIFGPILPVLPYDTLDDAIAHVNSGDRPLGLYVFGEDREALEQVIAETTSGGVSVNACALQGALPSLGFGGSGTSGMGRHHGIAGFREFSNQRGVVVRGTGDMIDAFYAPYEKAAGLVQLVLAGSA